MRSGSTKVVSGSVDNNFYPHPHGCDECGELAKGNRSVFTQWVCQEKGCRGIQFKPCPYHLKLTRVIKLKLFGIHPN